MNGSFATLSIYLGTTLGLYKAISDIQPCSPQQLAQHTGYHARWVEEWLFSQAANQLITHDGGEMFHLTDVQKKALVEERSSTYVGGVGFTLKATAQSVDKTASAFQTGVGCKYDDHGSDMAQAISKLQAPWLYNHLLDCLLSIEGVKQKLETGTKFADIGCGGGEAVILLAKKFPKSEFHGYDISAHAHELAAKHLKEAGLTNVTFHNPLDEKQRLPEDHSFGVIMNIDAIHDMAEPLPVVKAIGKALAKDGVWVSSEPGSCGSLAANLQHPMAALLSGFSVFVCMSSAMSEPTANGFGTMGLTQQKFENMCSQAGLHIATAHDGNLFKAGHNIIYEIRPKPAST